MNLSIVKIILLDFLAGKYKRKHNSVKHLLVWLLLSCLVAIVLVGHVADGSPQVILRLLKIDSIVSDNLMAFQKFSNLLQTNKMSDLVSFEGVIFVVFRTLPESFYFSPPISSLLFIKAVSIKCMGLSFLNLTCTLSNDNSVFQKFYLSLPLTIVVRV